MSKQIMSILDLSHCKWHGKFWAPDGHTFKLKYQYVPPKCMCADHKYWPA